MVVFRWFDDRRVIVRPLPQVARLIGRRTSYHQFDQCNGTPFLARNEALRIASDVIKHG